MKIVLLLTGKTSDKHISGVADLYISRIRRYSAFEVIIIPDLKNAAAMPVAEQKAKEGRKILQSVGPDDYIILLD
jgi:23S rRNA (pseudouridine1915-N3)-methyltransferase